MQTIIVLCVLAGFLLGLRFKALVLVPSTALAVAMIAVEGADHGFFWLARAAVVAAIAIQCGYLAGGVAIHATSGARARLAHSAAARSAERIRGAVSR